MARAPRNHPAPGWTPAGPWLAALACLLMAALAPPARAQTEPAARTAEEPAEAAPAAPEAAAPLDDEDLSQPLGPADPFNRGTPRGSLYGYVSAAREGDYQRAARYLDLRRLSPAQRDAAGDLARQLLIVLERTLWIDYAKLSPEAEGDPADGLPGSVDRVGSIETKRGSVDVLMQRVPRSEDGVRIWKIAPDIVQGIPNLYAEFGYGPLERFLPPVFFEVRAFDLQLWQWLGLVGLVFVAWLLSWLLATLAIRLLHPLFSRTATEFDDRIIELLKSPARLALAVVLFTALSVPLGLTLVALAWIAEAAQVLLIVAFSWAITHLVDLAALVLRERMLTTQQPGAVAFLNPGRRTAKAFVVLIAGIAILGNLGFNVTALVAGFGVGGIAVALAAQKTIENLFGGVMLFADRPVRVGDFCKFGDTVGTVEEIGLRSTKVRSLDRTLITVPNADFSSMQLENFAARDQIRLFTTLGLRYETTPEQLRYALARLREMLAAHPKIAPEPARVRFVAFGAYSLDLEVFAYAKTSDWNEFLKIREDVFLRMMDIVDEAGSGFAFPSSTTYLAQDGGLDAEHGREAAERVAAWRQEGVLPFPDFPEKRRAEIDDSLDWPPAGSPEGPRPAG